MVTKLKMVCNDHLHHTQYKFKQIKPVDVLTVIRQWIEVLAVQKELEHLGIQMKDGFWDVFSEIPHLEELPTDVFCRIKLKYVFKMVQMRMYTMPQKYHEAWATLIQQHLDAGHIHPSN